MKLISEFVVSNYLTISKIFKSPTKPASWHSKVLFGKAFAKRFCVGVRKVLFMWAFAKRPYIAYCKSCW